MSRSVRRKHIEHSMQKANDNLVWIDMEMTGLDASKDSILEVACIITDPNLNIVAEGPDLIIHQPNDVLQSMNVWSLKHHKESGLTEASKCSTLTIQTAEQQLMAFLKSYIPPGTCPLAGNSVYMDRLFIMNHMPEINNYLHYRIIDVSTVKELCRRWKPHIYENAPPKIFCHRALTDIKESIKELQYYQSAFFNLC